MPELLPAEVNSNEPAVGTLSVSEMDTLQNLTGNSITHNQPKSTVSIIPNTSVLKDIESALPVTPVMHDPAPSTSADSNPPLDTSEVRQGTTTTCTSENDSDIEILPDDQNVIPSINTVDKHPMDTTVDCDKTPVVNTPNLTWEALDKIIKNQPKVCLTSSKKSAREKPASKELPNTDQNNLIINNQPKVRITWCMVPSTPEKSGKVKPK